MTPISSSGEPGASLVVEEHNGHIAALVFKGSIRHVHCIRSIWANGRLAPPENPAASPISAGLNKDERRHWYRIQVSDEPIQ